MTKTQLKAARIALGLNQAEMATALRTPYRTYQDWEYGARRIPGVVAVACERLLQKDRWVMQAINEKLAALGPLKEV